MGERLDQPHYCAPSRLSLFRCHYAALLASGSNSSLPALLAGSVVFSMAPTITEVTDVEPVNVLTSLGAIGADGHVCMHRRDNREGYDRVSFSHPTIAQPVLTTSPPSEP